MCQLIVAILMPQDTQVLVILHAWRQQKQQQKKELFFDAYFFEKYKTIPSYQESKKVSLGWDLE